MANYHGESGVAPKKPMSLWWPMGMLIAWIVFIAIGAGLIGGVAAQASNCISSYNYSYSSSSSYSDLSSCADRTSQPMFIAGAVFVVIGGICHLLFWILLIVFFVKRSNHRRAQNVYLTTNQQAATASPAYQNNYQAGGYGPQAQQGYYNNNNNYQQQPTQQYHKA